MAQQDVATILSSVPYVLHSTSRNASSVGQVIACRKSVCNASQLSEYGTLANTSSGVLPERAVLDSNPTSRVACIWPCWRLCCHSLSGGAAITFLR